MLFRIVRLLRLLTIERQMPTLLLFCMIAL